MIFIKNHGFLEGTKKSLNHFWKMHKWKCLIVILICVFLLFLPIWPQTATENITLNVPVQQSPGGFDYAIKIFEQCDLLSFFNLVNDFESIPLTNKKSFYSNVKDPQVITYTFKEYNISIYAISTCKSCINTTQLGFSPQKCAMNNTMIFGYFEKCNLDKCDKTPFMVTEDIDILAPDNSFKISFTPYVEVSQSYNSNSGSLNYRYEYSTEMLLTYRKIDSSPYKNKVISLILAFSDIKDFATFFNEGWQYNSQQGE